MGNPVIYLWLPILVIVVTLTLNWFYWQPLYYLGQRMILYGQRFSTPILDAFFVFFTFLIEPYFVIGTLSVTLLLLKNKFQASMIAIAVLLNTYMFTLMKAFMTSPRPFWTNKIIKNIGYYCPKDWGSPSGHTEFAVFIFCIYLFHFTQSRTPATIGTGLFIIFFVMASRMYLGGHSLDQVLFGFIVAASFAVIYQFGGLRQKIQEILRNFRNPKINSKVLLFLIAGYTLAFLVYFKNLYKDQNFYREFKIWTANFNAKCPFKIKPDYLNENSFMAESVLLSAVFGYFMAFDRILQDKDRGDFLKGNWKLNIERYGYFAKPILVVMSLALALVPALLLYPLFYYPLVQIFVSRTFLLQFLVNNLAAAIAPYFLIAVTLIFSKRIGLIQIIPPQEKEELTKLE